MLVYLSKKIAIPNQVKLHCISWNRDQGWIACGGEAGLLKVLKLEALSTDSKSRGISAPTNLSMNQTLEGHNGIVMCLAWNPCHQKLTTSDETGLIIVWCMHKGIWYEEMINNRNKSVVRDMKWTSDGKKICIVYEDGAVIVGSVDGNRLWGSEFNMSLFFVEWSPDCKHILFGSGEGDIWIYDSDGTKVKQLAVLAADVNSGSGRGDRTVIAMEWYDGKGGLNPSKSSSSSSQALQNPNLCIALQNGVIQLNRGSDDVNPLLLNTHMVIQACKWNADGTVLTVTGYQMIPSGGGNMTRDNLVKFFTATGDYIRTLHVPGDEIRGLTWEGSNLRIAMAVDSFIYFANNRPSYTWAYLLDTVIYTRPRADRGETVAVFWDLSTGETISKHVVNLKYVQASGDFCVFVVQEKNTAAVKQLNTAANTKDDGKEMKMGDALPSPTNAGPTASRATLCSIQLRNAIGAIIDVKSIPFVPTRVSMGPYHIVVANERTVYTWQYMSATMKSAGTASVAGAMAAKVRGGEMEDDDDGGNGGRKRGSDHLRGGGKERIFDIANIYMASPQSPETYTMITEEIPDPIDCLTISDKYLVVAHHSGNLVRFTLPHLSVENTYQARNCTPVRIAMNCTSTRLSVIDESGSMTVYDMEAKAASDTHDNSMGDDVQDAGHDGRRHGDGPSHAGHFGKRMNIERRDVWDMCWAEDNEEMLCVMEKTKMVILRGETPEAPVQSAGYLARFRDLEVRSVNLDDLLLHPEQPDKECVVDYESKDLRDIRDKIVGDSVIAGYNLANHNPHPRLWKLIAEKALEELDLSTAEKAFVRAENYYGIQLVKQLRSMTDKNKAKAEVAVFLGRFDEAEAIYRGIDRKDLALQMRNRIGEYSRVVQLLQTGGGSDKLIRSAWDRIGDYYADRFKWRKAIQYYSQCSNYEKLAECYYRLQMFNELSALATQVPDGTPLLAVLANMFDTIGMYEQAVDVYLRSNNPRAAVDCCILQNRWERALELAEQHDFPQTEGLLQRFAGELIMKKKWLEAVELYRRANRPTEAAILLGEIAERAATKDVKPSLAKKLHVLAALEVERHRKRTMDHATTTAMTKGGGVAQATAATLETLMMTSLEANATTTTLVGQTTSNTSANKTSKAFASAWRGAAAYHFYMLAQRQYYAGHMDAAMKTAIKLCEYDDILPPRDIYSLLALAAYSNKFFGICSQAFVKLETLPTGVPSKDREEIETLAVKIFSVNVPTDPASLPDVYMRCLEVGKSYKACAITGRAILESPASMCKVCRHMMLEHEKKKDLTHCPLCHCEMH